MILFADDHRFGPCDFRPQFCDVILEFGKAEGVKRQDREPPCRMVWDIVAHIANPCKLPP